MRAECGRSWTVSASTRKNPRNLTYKSSLEAGKRHDFKNRDAFSLFDCVTLTQLPGDSFANLTFWSCALSVVTIRRTFAFHSSNGSCYLIGTQASGANTNGFRSSVYHGFNLSQIRLPGSVCSFVGMADLDTKNHAFSANCTFCHLSYTSCNV